MTVPILILAALSFVLSWGITFVMIRLAPRLGLVDEPGARKIHQNPKPLGGGVALFWAITIPIMIVMLLAWNPSVFGTFEVVFLALTRSAAVDAPSRFDPYLGGIREQTPLAIGVLGSMLLLHVVGLLDDRWALGPFVKLLVQIAVASGLVVGFEMRALEAAGYVPSVVLTVLWIVAVTNAFNFLDNMDGLSAGVAAVCATAFLITALTVGQWFVAAALALLLGAVVAFLCFNFPPATIFMGDAGSLVIGFLLGVLTVRTQFLADGTDWGAGWYAVFAPVIVLAVPLYDTGVVLLLRVLRGRSPFIGDTNHFSHRLVARGMSQRTAVLCIYLVTAATSMAAILLPHVRSTFGAMLIFAQTLLVLGVVALLEQHPLPTLAPSAGTPGEGGGEGDFERPAPFAPESHPHPSPLPAYRERG